MSGYKRVVAYHFEAGDYWWSVDPATPGQTHLEVEELRKNGQEDSHVYAGANLVNGKWVVTRGDEYGSASIVTYFGDEAADALEAFLNEHGLPSPMRGDWVMTNEIEGWRYDHVEDEWRCDERRCFHDNKGRIYVRREGERATRVPIAVALAIVKQFEAEIGMTWAEYVGDASDD